jgi:penicillin amidase
MRTASLLAVLLLTSTFSPSAAQVTTPAAAGERLRIDGLERPVEIIRDRWGINHIYAETQADLFFAQGYAAARDRLFQFEIWRRQATGTIAEILGPREIERDRGTRLFMFRGDMTREMEHYHPDGVEIITSYVRGVNAYVAEARANPDRLPIEFGLLDILPEPWTPEVVISRHQGLLGNIGAELDYGRAVHAIGPERVRAVSRFHPTRPGQPQLALDPAIDGSLLSSDILGVYEAFRRPIRFQPEDIVVATRRNTAGSDSPETFVQLARAQEAEWQRRLDSELEDIGSNNWVVSGERTQTGFPMMANDPHRTLAAPSLRYWVHLVGPGWNVIGGGEPEIPGVSIGHNGYGAWGLTVFSTDGEDLYVYDTNPSNPDEYRYQGRWEAMRVIVDTIPVEGRRPEVVELKYTRHGPVVYEDPGNDVAYAVRAAWMEVGGSPYLASLRMDQARTWEEFVDASHYSNIPGENMVWADREGNIGWQSVGIAPVRRNWSGLVPVPGDGRYEWDGYLPIRAKPSVYNPPDGYFGTANSNLTSLDYPHRDEAIGWTWADPFRWARVNEVLGSGRKLSMADMMALQVDYVSIPARTLVPLLSHLRPDDPRVEAARRQLLSWGDGPTGPDGPVAPYEMAPTSIEAAIYNAWEGRVRDNLHGLMVPNTAKAFIRSVSLANAIDWILAPPGQLGNLAPDGDPLRGRDILLEQSLDQAVEGLTNRLGQDMKGWSYGQEAYKHVYIRHPLSAAVDTETRSLLDLGPLPRGGYGSTVGNTGGGDNQGSGASFRIIVDTEDWDNSVGANTPGQSGDPDSPHYRNLFELWASDRFFPVVYSRERVEAAASERLRLEPGP